jgi:hypothetical protein
MATVLEQCNTEEQSSVVRFLWAKDIHKELFPVYGGKCLSREAVHNWADKFTQGRSKVAGAGFDARVRRWDECMNVGGGYVEK